MTGARGVTARDLATLVAGTLVGQGDIVLAGVASVDRAGPADLAFVAPHYAGRLAACRAGAVLVPPSLADADGPATRIVVPDPESAVVRALEALYPSTEPPWGIDPAARLGRGVSWQGRIAVGPGAVLEEGVALGRDCRIGAQAVLCRGTRLGDRVVVHAGARVGGSGFGFLLTDGSPQRIPHVAGCVIGDDVEIGANSTIDRGKLEATTIGPCTKVDNLVHVGHSVQIGARCVIMAQVGIAGSTVVEDDVMLAGQAGLADHLRVGCGARVAAQSGVIGDIAAGGMVSGYPARPHRQVLRQAAALERLAPLARRLERLAKPSG